MTTIESIEAVLAELPQADHSEPATNVMLSARTEEALVAIVRKWVEPRRDTHRSPVSQTVSIWQADYYGLADDHRGTGRPGIWFVAFPVTPIS